VIGWLTAKNCRNKILKKVFAGKKLKNFCSDLFLWRKEVFFVAFF